MTAVRGAVHRSPAISVQDPRLRCWLVACWIGIILFSSTNIAMQWAYGLFNLSAQVVGTTAGLGLARFIAQKMLHVSLFAGLGFQLARLRITNGRWRPGFYGLTCFAVGAASETLQALFDLRQPSLADFLLNGMSGSIACWMGIESTAHAGAEGTLAVTAESSGTPG